MKTSSETLIKEHSIAKQVFSIHDAQCFISFNPVLAIQRLELYKKKRFLSFRKLCLTLEEMRKHGTLDDEGI